MQVQLTKAQRTVIMKALQATHDIRTVAPALAGKAARMMIDLDEVVYAINENPQELDAYRIPDYTLTEVKALLREVGRFTQSPSFSQAGGELVTALTQARKSLKIR